MILGTMQPCIEIINMPKNFKNGCRIKNVYLLKYVLTYEENNHKFISK